MAWIQSYQELRDHPKTIRLSVALKIPRAEAVGILHFLWWWAYDYAPDGDLSPFSDEEVEAGVSWTGRPGALMGALMASPDNASAWVDPDRRLHHWDHYTGALRDLRTADAQRTKRWRQKRNDAATGSADNVGGTSAEHTDNVGGTSAEHTDNVRSTRYARVTRAESSRVESNRITNDDSPTPHAPQPLSSSSDESSLSRSQRHTATATTEPAHDPETDRKVLVTQIMARTECTRAEAQEAAAALDAKLARAQPVNSPLEWCIGVVTQKRKEAQAAQRNGGGERDLVAEVMAERAAVRAAKEAEREPDDA